MPHRLVWNGDCGFCRAAAEFVARHDRARAFELRTSQELGLGALAAVRVESASGQTYDGGRACLFVAGVLWPRTRPAVRFLARSALRLPVDAAYRAGAGLRYLRHTSSPRP
jgi:predicted DCC family thiol-disulfide oxidoreductase YuxK